MSQGMKGRLQYARGRFTRQVAREMTPELPRRLGGERGEVHVSKGAEVRVSVAESQTRGLGALFSR